jgi:hypothetical protein
MSVIVINCASREINGNNAYCSSCKLLHLNGCKVTSLASRMVGKSSRCFPKDQLHSSRVGADSMGTFSLIDPSKIPFLVLELKFCEWKVLPSNQSPKRPWAHAHDLNQILAKKYECSLLELDKVPASQQEIRGTLRKITKQDLAKRIGGLITSQPIMFMGT